MRLESGQALPSTMLSRRVFPLFLASLMPGVAAAASAPIWVSGEVPPFLWQGAGGPEGYAYELFQRVLKQADLQAQLRFYPWARALRMLEVRQAHAALVMTRAPEREGQYRWLFPVGRYRFAIVTRARDVALRSDLAALRGVRVGSMRASVGRNMLGAAGVNQVVEGKDFSELFALLDRGIVDAVFGPDAVMRSLGGSDERLRFTLIEPAQELHAAAGPAMPDALVQRIHAAYQQLVDTGAVAQLRKRHPGVFADE